MLALVVALLASVTACLPQAKEGDRCNNPGETRVEGNDVFQCTKVPGETEKNFFGKEFPVSRWRKLKLG